MTGLLPETMRAFVATAYGGPEVLALRELPLPRIGRHDVLIRVEATTVSAADRRIRAMDLPPGFGLMGRLAFGIARPRRPVLGTELTGMVVACGEQVKRFAPGDRVIAFSGVRMGAHADYAVMKEEGAVIHRPPSMPADVAAALAFGGLTARDYLRKADVRRGERVLVIGASGTVGSALVQLAAHAGAKVTAVASGANAETVLRLGAEAVIDYGQRDVTTENARWDIIADAVGALTFRRALPILAEGGRYLAIAGGLGDLLARRKGSRRPIAGPSAERMDDLLALANLWERGVYRPLIDSILPFESLPEAHRRADSGRKRGSIVIMMRPPAQ